MKIIAIFVKKIIAMEYFGKVKLSSQMPQYIGVPNLIEQASAINAELEKRDAENTALARNLETSLKNVQVRTEDQPYLQEIVKEVANEINTIKEDPLEMAFANKQIIKLADEKFINNKKLKNRVHQFQNYQKGLAYYDDLENVISEYSFSDDDKTSRSGDSKSKKVNKNGTPMKEDINAMRRLFVQRNQGETKEDENGNILNGIKHFSVVNMPDMTGIILEHFEKLKPDENPYGLTPTQIDTILQHGSISSLPPDKISTFLSTIEKSNPEIQNYLDFKRQVMAIQLSTNENGEIEFDENGGFSLNAIDLSKLTDAQSKYFREYLDIDTANETVKTKSMSDKEYKEYIGSNNKDIKNKFLGLQVNNFNSKLITDLSNSLSHSKITASYMNNDDAVNAKKYDRDNQVNIITRTESPEVHVDSFKVYDNISSEINALEELKNDPNLSIKDKQEIGNRIVALKLKNEEELNKVLGELSNSKDSGKILKNIYGLLMDDNLSTQTIIGMKRAINKVYQEINNTPNENLLPYAGKITTSQIQELTKRLNDTNPEIRSIFTKSIINSVMSNKDSRDKFKKTLSGYGIKPIKVSNIDIISFSANDNSALSRSFKAKEYSVTTSGLDNVFEQVETNEPITATITELINDEKLNYQTKNSNGKTVNNPIDTNDDLILVPVPSIIKRPINGKSASQFKLVKKIGKEYHDVYQIGENKERTEKIFTLSQIGEDKNRAEIISHVATTLRSGVKDQRSNKELQETLLNYIGFSEQFDNIPTVNGQANLIVPIYNIKSGIPANIKIQINKNSKNNTYNLKVFDTNSNYYKDITSGADKQIIEFNSIEQIENLIKQEYILKGIQ